ncbi:MAG: hypothetical protein MZV64_70620 [Ignavibacteriales bacterium]|nr:hypothetical protein [Ignavibacteriales bacterium]
MGGCLHHLEGQLLQMRRPQAPASWPPKCGSRQSWRTRTSQPASAQQRVQVALRRSVHRIHHHLEARLADHLQAHQAPQPLQVGLAGIDPLDQASRLRLARRDAPSTRGPASRALARSWICRAASGSAGPPQVGHEPHAVVLGRIAVRRDDHAACRLPPQYLEDHHGRRRIPLAQQRLDSLGPPARGPPAPRTPPTGSGSRTRPPRRALRRGSPQPGCARRWPGSTLGHP